MLSLMSSPSPWVATILALYLALCSSLRFRHEKSLLRRFGYTDRASLSKMTSNEASEIFKSIMAYEFPKLYNAALQLAIFKVSHNLQAVKGIEQGDPY
jgi:hypothetical protein